MKKRIQKKIEKELKDLEFTKEEKDEIVSNLDKFKQNEGYQLLKKKFYLELESIDYEIALLENNVSNMASQEKIKVIAELERQKQELINLCGFVFEYGE